MTEDAQFSHGIARTGVYPHPDKEVVRCHRCGRPTARCREIDEYVFGVICGRADCQRVEEMLAEQFRCQEASWATPGERWYCGPSAWTPDAEVPRDV